MKKNSDSDYKAEDEGSASDSLTHKKPNPRKHFPTLNPKLNKKQMIEFLSTNFLPEGITLSKEVSLSQPQYKELLSTEDAPQFSLNFKTFIGKVVKLVDGDTFKAVIFLNGIKSRFTFRVDGIDTPETRKGKEQNKEFGRLVKDIVNGLIGNKIVKIQAGGFDKYGRVLSRVYIKEKSGKEFCLNQWLIEGDMAKPYFGKGKIEFTSQEYRDFKEKHNDRKWPVTINYPFQ